MGGTNSKSKGAVVASFFEQYDLISKSGLFDADFYLAKNADVAGQGLDPVVHYLEKGAIERRDPHPEFDTRYYFEQCAERDIQPENALLHFLMEGHATGMAPHRGSKLSTSDRPASRAVQTSAAEIDELAASTLFDRAFYCASYSLSFKDDRSAIRHFLSAGFPEGKRPNLYFDPVWYLEQYPEVHALSLNPLLHYYKLGEALGWQPSLIFDPTWYRETYGVVDGSPLAHFLANRTSCRFSPIPEFDVRYYVTTNRDVRDAGVDPFEHFLLVGYREGRNPSATFGVKDYAARQPVPGRAAENPLLHFLQQKRMRQLGGRESHVRNRPAGSVSPTQYLDELQLTQLKKTGIVDRVPDPPALPRQTTVVLRGTASDVASSSNVMRSAAGASIEVVRSDPRLLAQRVFDENWYQTCRPRDIATDLPGFEHWWNYGRAAGLSPHPLFDTSFYAKQPRVAGVAVKDLFLHFLKEGQEASADPHPCFSMHWYRLRYAGREEKHPWLDYLLNGNVKHREPNWLFSARRMERDGGDRSDRTALENYLQKLGHTEQSPHALLDLSFVLRHNKDIGGANPYLTFWQSYRVREIRTHLYFDPRHYAAQIKGRPLVSRAFADYVLHGEAQGLTPIPLFLPHWYRQHYGYDGYDSALEDFTDIGEKLFRHPCPGFDPRYYLENHPDVARAKHAPLRHFIIAGQRECRRTHSRLDLPWYSKQLPNEEKPRALEHFLDVGRRRGDSPHPAVKIDARGGRSEAIASFLTPTAVREHVVPGVRTALAGNYATSSCISPAIDGQPWLVERLEQMARTHSALSADRLKRWEPIARQYENFDENAALTFSSSIESRFGADRSLPRVSVIMPTRNRANVLKRAINSVLSQTHRNVELIVVDDGGTDGTDKLIQSHFDDPRIVYVRISASGVSAARNEGLKRARGDFIAYLDSDNYWEPRHLELVLKAMVLGGASAAYSVLRIFNAGATVKYRGDRFDLDSLQRENYIDMNVYVHSREAIESGLAFDESLRRCVDWDFILRNSVRATPLFVPIIGCNYVDDSGALERITTNELSGDFYRVCQRNINLKAHIVGEAPSAPCKATIVWPISPADWSASLDDLWAAVHHVAETDVELIIINNALPAAATNLLAAIARTTRKVRVINLWRSFLEFPATNLAAQLALSQLILLWRSGTVYDADSIDALIGASENSLISVPLVVNDQGIIANDLARVDLTSAVLQPVLTGQAIAPGTGMIRGIVPMSGPVLLDRPTFLEAGGFDPSFAVTYGLADFAARMLVRKPTATVLHLNVRLRTRGVVRRPSQEGEFVKELEALRQRWLGKLRVPLELPGGMELAAPRTQKSQVVSWNLLPDPNSGARVAVPMGARALHFVLRCPAPDSPEKLFWGDYHYAESILDALKDFGHSGSIELRDAWQNDNVHADVVLHIRGIVDVRPVPGAVNAMWVISHPEKIQPGEYAGMDLVFVAGPHHRTHLRQTHGVDAHLLPQATDPRRFNSRQVRRVESVGGKLLFVGNSRLQLRRIVLDSIQQDLPVVIYGKDWDHLVPAHVIGGEYISNEELGNWYGSAGIVLNDHWPTMREYGVISNRIFDAVASGRPVLTDPVDGLQDIFGEAVATYEDPAELPRLVENLSRVDCTAISEYVRAKHSIRARVEEILRVLDIKKR